MMGVVNRKKYYMTRARCSETVDKDDYKAVFLQSSCPY